LAPIGRKVKSLGVSSSSQVRLGLIDASAAL
jgi:hypothetical protein